MTKIILAFLLISAIFFGGCKGKQEEQPSTTPSVTDKEVETVTEPISPAPPASDVSSGIGEPIINTPPRIVSIDVEPQTPRIGGRIKAEVKTHDREGDDVTIEYQWSRNETLLSEDSDTLLLTSDFKKNDTISLKAIPNDGKSTGNPVSIVMTIPNSSPEIKPSPETFRLDGNLYSYQVRAKDIDGDILIYNLVSAPPGMTINSSTGLIKWNVDFKGKAPVTVSVTDGDGGEILQSFTLEIVQ